MPMYEGLSAGLSYGGQKNATIFDLGAAYTK